MSAPLLVANSGPLIALARLDLLTLLARYFASVPVTASVGEEMTRSSKSDEIGRLTAALEAGQLGLVDDPAALPDAIPQFGLDIGQRNSIALTDKLLAGIGE